MIIENYKINFNNLFLLSYLLFEKKENKMKICKTRKEKKNKNSLEKKKICKKKLKIFIVNPPKFLQPLKYLRLMGDIPITDDFTSSKLEKSLVLTQYFQEFKKVNQVYFDKKLDVISAKVESTSNFFPPLGLIIDRLMSLNDLNAFQLAQTIMKYSTIVNTFAPLFEISSNVY